MSTRISLDDPAAEPACPDGAGDGSTRARGWRQWRAVVRIVQVRLRLLLIFFVAFLVVGQWDVLRTWFERLTAPRVEPRQQAISTDTEYFCPMDPGVVSDWPARCGVCNMALVRRSRADMGHLPDGVIARMQFSPYRLQIAGIRTAPVEYRPLAYEIVCGGTLRDEADASGTRRLVVEAEIPRLRAQRLTANSLVEILSPELPAADPRIAHVRSIEPPANPQRLSWSLLAELDEPPGELSGGAAVRARLKFPVAETEPFSALPEHSEHAGQVLAVPEAALIPSGQKRIVYLESAPGMFDAVEVRVGARAEGYYPVAQGLKAGQRVAAAGAFLIDAETRLDPHLAASYFGAQRATAPSAAAGAGSPVPASATTTESADQARSIAAALAELPPAQQAAARQQAACPVTGLALGTMGKPVAVTVAGRLVFLCCAGCEASLRKEPSKYLPKLPVPAAPRP